MIAYASRTGTKKNLKALRAAGWRLMLSATGVHRTEGFPYAIDNGAWTAYQQGDPFNAAAFAELLNSHAQGADFIVVPDVVAGGLDSLEFSRTWLPSLVRLGRPLFVAVQDGMTPRDVWPIVSSFALVEGIFVGGTTEWKEGTTPSWCAWGRQVGCKVHVGRVNTQRRLRLCANSGATSFDGSGPSRFRKHLEQMDRQLRQASFVLEEQA